MGFLEKFITAGGAGAAEKIGSVIERISAGHLGKKEAALEISKMQHEEVLADLKGAETVIAAKERTLIAELQQDDKFTKRARPTVIYCGPLLATVMVVMHYVGAFTGTAIPAPPGIEWFVSAWGVGFAAYAFNRSREKSARSASPLTSILSDS